MNLSFQPPEEDDPRDDDQRMSEDDKKETMNMISQLRARIQEAGLTILTADEYNQLQKEWITRVGADDLVAQAQRDAVAAKDGQIAMLIEGITKAATALGICRPDAYITGPLALMLCDDMAESNQAVAAAVPDVIAAKMQLYLESYKLMAKMVADKGDAAQAHCYHCVAVDIEKNMIPAILAAASGGER